MRRAVVSAGVNPSAAGTGDLIIRDVAVFDGVSAELVDGPVHVRAGRIVHVGPDGRGTPPEPRSSTAAVARCCRD